MTAPRFIQKWLTRGAIKALELSIVPSWFKVNWILPTFHRLAREGYKVNSVIFACISAYAYAMSEARPIVVKRDGTPAPDNLIQALLDHPNNAMGWKRLLQVMVVYMLIGGDVYLHKVRSKTGSKVLELWPYHSAQVEAVPSQTEWVDHYLYTDGSGKPPQVKSRDEFIQVSYPSVDPDKPWLSLPPIMAVAREIDTDNEASRYKYALLKNDATPRTVFAFPKEATDIEEGDIVNLKNQVAEKFSGDGRGGPIVTKGGLTVQRLGLNMQELAADALHRIPETRICAAFRIPPIVAGITAGLERSTYSNTGQSRAHWMQNSVVPLWEQIADALTHGLFGRDASYRITFDTSKVAALQQNANELSARLVAQYAAGLIKRSEARRELGQTVTPEDEKYGYEYPRTPSSPTPAPPLSNGINGGDDANDT